MSSPLSLRVSAIRAEARDILRIELQGADGRALPAAEAGAHIAITLPGAPGDEAPMVRHYSLCNAGAETDRYVIAVALEAGGRGGSRAVHERLRVGDRVAASVPRNNFPLAPDAGHHRFIAGGIGITPILSMIRSCERAGHDWSLLLCVRGRRSAAFLDELSAHGDRVEFHFGDERGRRADIAAALSRVREGEHVYCCGPASLMDAVVAATASRPASSIHVERFSVPAGDNALAAADRDFDVVLRRSQRTIHVNAASTLLEALESHGIAVPFACREGLCRTCETPICAGEAEHRDFVLSQAERAAQASLMVCVSRSRSAVLGLDL